MSQQNSDDELNAFNSKDTMLDQYMIQSILIPNAYWKKYHEAWYLTINNTPVRNKRHLCYIVFSPRSYPGVFCLEEQIRLEEVRCLMGE